MEQEVKDDMDEAEEIEKEKMRLVDLNFRPFDLPQHYTALRQALLIHLLEENPE